MNGFGLINNRNFPIYCRNAKNNLLREGLKAEAGAKRAAAATKRVVKRIMILLLGKPPLCLLLQFMEMLAWYGRGKERVMGRPRRSLMFVANTYLDCSGYL